MPLLEFWKSSPTAVEQLSIEQVVASAGDGALKHGSLCSDELRVFLAQIPSPKIAGYVDQCLTSSFPKSGLVLQDLINELGRRLDYEVTNGPYQGTHTTIGFDGFWKSPEGHTIIAEVKSTDAYRVSLDTIARYRDKLSSSGQIKSPSSVLVIVGRQDTGELEAQVRGSRHAWDIRLISADALIKLVQLKENADGPETGLKIRSLLTPMEYTRLDQMIDVMFTAATDAEAAVQSYGEEEDAKSGAEDVAPPRREKAKGTWEFTDSRLLQNKRDLIISSIGSANNTTFIKKTRALYWNASHELRLLCTISKQYTRSGKHRYWYAYHRDWDEFLRDGSTAFVVLGCMDLPTAFSIPWAAFHPLVETLNTTTTKDDYTYWHIQLVEAVMGHYTLQLPKKSSSLPLDEYAIHLIE